MAKRFAPRFNPESETYPPYLVDKFQLREIRGKREAISDLEGRSLARASVAKSAIRQLYRRALGMQTDMF